MTLKTLYLHLLIPVLVACKSGAGNQHQPLAPKADSTTANPGTAIPTCDTTRITENIYTIRNDQVIREALETDLSCKSLDHIYGDSKKVTTTSPNKYDTVNVDTTVLYHVDCDSVIYLSSNPNCFPLHLNIQSQRISFDNGAIKVGMAKEKFAEKYGQKKDIPDHIKISEMEGANELIFFFSGGVLHKIIYNNLYVE